MPGDPSYALILHRFGGTFELPDATPDGQYELGLVLPDARQASLDERFCIQLANADTHWATAGRRT